MSGNPGQSAAAAGGAQQGALDPMAAAQNAQASGTAGTAGSATTNANTPQWMQGLLGAMTGNTAYGKSAPAVHQMLQQGMQMMQPGGGQGMPQAPRSMARPPVPAGGAMPYPGGQGMAGAPPGPMGAPGMPGAPQGMQGQQQPGQNPWLQGIPGR